jgi:hypothetical protein
MYNSILVKFILLYIFFSPMAYFALRDTFGVSIGISRLLLLFIVSIFFLIAINSKKLIFSIYPIKSTNISYYILYSICSISVAYIVLFFTGGIEGYAVATTSRYSSIFRSQYVWPITQFISFLVTAVIPCAIISNMPTKSYFKAIKSMEYSIKFLVMYGVIQFVTYQLFNIVLNRMLLHVEGIPTEIISGISFLRVYSFAGEPKMYGTFLIGSILFYLPFINNNISKLIVFSSMIISLIFTFSTSAYLGVIISGLSLILILNNKKKIYIFVLIVFILAVYVIPLFQEIFEERLFNRIKSILIISGLLERGTDFNASYVSGRELDGTIFIYLMDLPNNIFQSFFGVGYGNLAFGVIEYMRNIFNFSFNEHIGTRLLGFQILVESGIVGLYFYINIAWYGYHYANRLYILLSLRLGTDSYETKLINGLKFGFVGHYLSSLIEVHYIAFIYLGLIMLATRYYMNHPLVGAYGNDYLKK